MTPKLGGGSLDEESLPARLAVCRRSAALFYWVKSTTPRVEFTRGVNKTTQNSEGKGQKSGNVWAMQPGPNHRLIVARTQGSSGRGKKQCRSQASAPKAGRTIKVATSHGILHYP